jgi:glycosyltransferase involved in cell wall biosynthesis
MIIYLIIGGEISGTGGLEKYVLGLANYLPKCSIDFKVIYRMGKTYENLRFEPQKFGEIRHTNLTSIFNKLNHLPNFLTIFLSILTIINDLNLQKSQNKIIHVHDISSSFFAGLFISKIFKIPLIVQIHGFPLKEQYIKVTKDRHWFSGFLWFLTKTSHHIALRLLILFSPIVLVNNQEVKYFYQRYGVRSEKIEIASGAIDLKKYQSEFLSKEEAKSCLKISDLHEFTIGFIGGLRSEKNIPVLIEAFSKLSVENPGLKASLIIIGDGPMRFSLENLVDKLHLKNRVVFTGFILNAYRVINAIDIFVLPSLSEGSPLCLIEAMASGRCIVASDIPAISEIVTNRQNAILFNPKKPEQLSSILLELSRHSSLRVELGRNAIKVSSQYDNNITFAKIIHLYRDGQNNNIDLK